MQLGISRLLNEKNFTSLLKGKRVGFLGHEASVNEALVPSVNLVRAAARTVGYQVTALFSPQHGFWGDEQDNMVETGHGQWDGIPLYSLYSETRKPTVKMLENVDTVVIDLQDIGTRIYTFIYTMGLMMEAASSLGKEVIVVDRPNPIGGELVQGTTLGPAYSSFVGLYPMPVRHGMTIGEIARWMNEKYELNCGRQCKLHVVPMEGWKRSMYWSETKLTFVMPSPNIPSPDSALTFPGFVYFEGTNVSEGRGTTRPLEQCGAPFLQSAKVMEHLDRELPEWRVGCVARETGFKPTFQKHHGVFCRGVFIHPTDRQKFNPALTGVALMRGIRELSPHEFAWKQPPYEYELTRLPIDMISGGPWIREWVEGRYPWKALVEAEKPVVRAFLEERKPFLLYR